MVVENWKTAYKGMYLYDAMLVHKYRKLIARAFKLVENAKTVSYWSQFRTEKKGFFEVEVMEHKGMCSIFTFPDVLPQGILERFRLWSLRRHFKSLPYDEGILAQVKIETKVKLQIINTKKMKKAVFTKQN